MKHDSTIANFVSARADGHPVPLKSTAYHVRVVSGLAMVRLVRVFRNEEDIPIEATITFPVPFESAVTGIEAKVGGKVLTGKAQARATARQSYEDAIDAGKPAVLHEELLRGLHMLSVANVAPGAEIEVSATFVTPLALEDGDGRFRIPVTVGQVYGEQPFVDSDRILTGGEAREADVTVTSASGTAFVNGAAATGAVKARLDSPVEVKVVGLYSGVPSPLVGRAADGRQVDISFAPGEVRDLPLDADFLLDTSGSMREAVARRTEGHGTKWDAVLAGLRAASGKHLTGSDTVTVWTFSSSCRRVAKVKGDALATLDVPFDSGGTEIAGAVAKVTGSRREANVLLVTDGKSWTPIDVQKAVETGARFTVVLVGEDSLESSVGYLAAMTGGQMFVSAAEDVAGAVAAAVAAMRDVASPAVPYEGRPESLERRISGVTVSVTWSKAGRAAPQREGEAAAWAGYAAQLALAGMKEGAAEFAAEEGIVSHLTSIVLVDEAADAVEGIPATRKVALPDPAGAVSLMALAAPPMPTSLRAFAGPASVAMSSWEEHPTVGGGYGGCLLPSGAGKGRGGRFGEWNDMFDPAPHFPDLTAPDPADFALPVVPETVKRRDWLSLREGDIVWDANPAALADGALNGLPVRVQMAVLALSSVEEVKNLADALGRNAVAVALALLAGKAAGGSRGAARIVRAVLGGAETAMLDAARRAAGL